MVMCSAQETPTNTPPARASLLVLNTGRVVTGHVTRRPDGYDVKSGAGRLFLSSNSVRFEAADMADAYRKMQSALKPTTPKAHIELARWCLKNSQLPAARQELLDALQLEPRNDTALSMLRRLEAKAVPPAAPKTMAQARIESFRNGVKHESLGGLTEKQAGIFTSQVQPILERRCGNSSCHGSRSNNDFKLKRTRGWSSTLTAERNLAVVLKQIDLRKASDSPLLQVFETPHTRDGRPLFPGRGGQVQKKIILDWVNSVVGEQSEKTDTRTEIASVKPMRKTAAIEAVTRPVTETEKKLVKDIRLSNEHDPFDPAEFNRKHHGRGNQ